jgi:carboxylesterase
MADRRSTLERPLCLVLHGLGGGPYELEPLTSALRAEGFRVLSPVLPGHDGPGPVMPASSWVDWAATAEAGFDELAAAGEPVAVVGFSTGGTLALRLATRRPIARQALLAPFLAIRYTGLIPLRPASYLRRLARLIPDLPRRPPAVRDRALRRRLATASPFNTFSLAATLSALELIDEVKEDVPEIRVPTLILQGRLDTVVEPANAGWLYRTLGTAESDKRLVFMEHSDHLLALDRERDRVIAETLAFLHGSAGAAPQHAPGHDEP